MIADESEHAWGIRASIPVGLAISSPFPHHAKCHTVQEAPWVEAGSGAVSPGGGNDKEWDAIEKNKTPYHL